MRDLIKLSQRIDQIIPEDKRRVQQIYDYITSDNFCVIALKHLSPIEIIKICFLINESRRGRSDLSYVLSELENIFIFSTIHFSGERRYSCYDCGGDGNVRCGNCGGSGGISCDTCDGDGKIVADDEESESECETCDGKGSIDCEECDDGYITCEYCDGTGETTEDGLEYTISLFVSYSSKLKKMVKNNFDETQSLSQKIMYDITDNSKTISFFENDSSDENIDTSFEGDTYINEFKDGNELSYLDKSMTNNGRWIKLREDDLEEVNRKFY